MGSASLRVRKVAPVFTPGSEGTARTIGDFLEWLETSRGLRLCVAFKPQYDWYVPVPANIGALAREFLGNQGSRGSTVPIIPSIPTYPRHSEA